jgi:hypothetical protein
MDRVGEGEIVADPFSVSIFGNIQPRIWRKAIPLLTEEGFLARFIPCVLRGEKNALSQPLPDDQTSKAAYEMMIRQVYALPKQTYTLSPEAYQIFRDHQAWTIARQKEDRVCAVDETYEYAFGKGDGTVGRLALVFHLIMTPFLPEVPGRTMEMAVRFFQDFIVPSLRYAYGEVGNQLKGSLDVWMASHLLAIADKDQVTLRELKHSARRQMGDDLMPYQRDQLVIDAMIPLEACNWVKLLEDNRRANSYKWAINPQLKDTFAEYRKQALIIRQRRADKNQAIIAKHKAKRGEKWSQERTVVPGYNSEWDDED